MNNYCRSAIIFVILSVTGNYSICLSESPIPSSVDNRATPYFPEVIRQQGESCASANGVGYIFTYEINAARNLPSSDPVNQYPYFGTYNFLNDGSDENGTYTMFIDAWEIIRDNGIPNALDFGKPDLYATKWMSGYEKYFRAMHNRIESIDSLSFLEAGALYHMKRWLYNHATASSIGGIFTVTACAYGVQDTKLSAGPEKGKWIIHKFGTSISPGAHALAVVGYNDSILYDYNRDGSVTDTIDINGDGIIDQRDHERGAFILANTWGESSGDGGFIYAPYRLFTVPLDSGGLISNRAYFITVRRDYRPIRAFKFTIDHSQRNMIAIAVGIAADTSSSEPQCVRSIRQFSYSGGSHPMCGKNGSSIIEIGLDVSDLSDSVPCCAPVAYFLIVDVKDSSGRCAAFSLMDYSSETSWEILSDDTPRNFTAGRNIFKVVAPTINVCNRRSKVGIPSMPVFYGAKEYLRMTLPAGIIRIDLLTIQGENIYSLNIENTYKTAGMFSIPNRTAAGSCIVRLTGNNKAHSCYHLIKGIH